MGLNPTGGQVAPLPTQPVAAPAPAAAATTPQTGFVGSGDPYSPAELNGPTGTRPPTLPANYVYDAAANGGQGGWTPGNPARGAPPASSTNTQYQGGGAGNAFNTFDASGKSTGQVDPKTGKPVAPDPARGGPNQYEFIGPAAAAIKDKVGNALSKAKADATGLLNSVDPSQSADAQTSRDFGSQLRDAYAGFQPAAAPQLDATKLNTDQATQRANINAEQGIANGTTKTAADALLQQGTDQAAKNATGLAAQYSAQNPGQALRAGLAASNNAYATAAAPAAQLKAQEQQTAMGAIQGAGASLAGQDTTAAGANQNATLTTNAQNNQQQLGLGTLAANQTNAPLNTDIAGAQAKAQLLGAGASAGGGLIAALSDKRAKKNIKKASFVDAMAKNIHGATYEYKPGAPTSARGKQSGVMAQDVEKVFPGMVAKGADGLKRVDTGHAALATMGVVSELARRLKEIEGKKKGKKAA